MEVAHLTPAKRDADDEIGFYDTVRNVFLANAGIGEFDYGEYLFKINVSAEPPKASVYQSKFEVPNGESVYLFARPFPLYKFVKWSDGSTTNPRTITPTADVNLVAQYQKETDSSAVYLYRCFIKDQMNLTDPPKAFLRVDTFDIRTDLLTNATSSIWTFTNG